MSPRAELSGPKLQKDPPTARVQSPASAAHTASPLSTPSTFAAAACIPDPRTSRSRPTRCHATMSAATKHSRIVQRRIGSPMEAQTEFDKVRNGEIPVVLVPSWATFFKILYQPVVARRTTE